MATFGMCAALIGRQHFAFLAVIISGYLMLFIQPGYLFDLGFQLSFLATIGIICLKPIFPIKAGMFGDVIATTIAAQIATLPVLLMAIGKVGIFSILVNLLVLWTIPFIMFLGSIAAIVNLIFSVGASIFIIIAIPLLVYMSIIISTFGSWGGVISFDSMPWYFSAAYYAFLTALILKKRTYLLTTTLSQSFASERHG
jgi:competence protein ComEC